MVSGFIVVAIASHGPKAHAVSAAGVSYQNAHGQLAAQSLHLGGQNPAQAASQTVYATPNHYGKQNVNSTTTAARSAPGADSLSVQQNAPTVLHNFNGLSAMDNAKIAGVLVHPPDQGLCVGHDASIAGNPEVEFELINLVVAEYNVNGVVQKSALLPSGKENLNNFFNEPNTPFSGGELVSDLQPGRWVHEGARVAYRPDCLQCDQRRGQGVQDRRHLPDPSRLPLPG